jgi:hypothetical protein
MAGLQLSPNELYFLHCKSRHEGLPWRRGLFYALDQSYSHVLTPLHGRESDVYSRAAHHLQVSKYNTEYHCTKVGGSKGVYLVIKEKINVKKNWGKETQSNLLSFRYKVSKFTYKCIVQLFFFHQKICRRRLYKAE